MTPDWNPTDMRQVEGRIWRRDNENYYVRIVYVLLDQSVEVFIYSKLEEKARRLRQIMLERDTIQELEEMSLDPNETKVALASDPEKRADIVTKLSQAILTDQRNKINKSREEIKGVTENLDLVYEKIGIAKENYLMPYIVAFAEHKKEMSEYVINDVVGLFHNDKPEFVRKFIQEWSSMGSRSNWSSAVRSQSYIETIKNKLSKDQSLLLSLQYLWALPTVNDVLSWIPTLADLGSIQDVINAFEIGIEKRELFLVGNTDNTIHIDAINENMPLRISNPYQWPAIDNRLTGKFDASLGTQFFKLPTIIYAYTDDMRDILLAGIKEIKARQAKGVVPYYELRDVIFPKIAMALMESISKYVSQSPFVRPENYYPYFAAQQEKNYTAKYTEDEFDTFDLTKKINELANCYRELDNIGRNFDGYSVGRKRDIIAGKEKAPTEAQILVAVGIASDDKAIQVAMDTELIETFRPITRMYHNLHDVEELYLKIHGITIDKLPELAAKYNKDYNDITKKLADLEIQKIKLIERYKKVNEQRSKITIDDIVAKFAESNTLLESKLRP
jgi:hypothetical protein